MKILKALLAASLLAPLPALAGAPPIPPAPTILVGGGTPVMGTCPSTQFLYNNAGILGCSAGSGASMSIGGAVTGGTTGYGLYINGASLGQFAYGANVYAALGLAANATSGLPLINGTMTAGDCVKWSATGIQDAGSACGAGGGTAFPVTVSGTVNSGGIPYFSSTTNMATSAALAANALMIGGGAGVAPSTVTTGAGVVAALGIAPGTTGSLATQNGAITTGDCLKWGPGVQDAGSACGSGGGTLTAGTTATSGFTAGQLLMSNGTSLAVAGAANAASLALGGATIGTSALAVTGDTMLGTNLWVGGSTSNAGLVSGGSGAGGDLYVGNSGSNFVRFSPYNNNSPLGDFGLILGHAAAVGWTSSGGATNSADMFLLRDGAGQLALQYSTNAQSFRVYNTWSSSGTNYERGIFDWQTTANVLTIGTTNGGTGLARSLVLETGGVTAMTINTSQAVAFAAGITTGSTTLQSTSVALTNGAGASAGTLTNAPAVGNPTKWIPINDNGTTRYIPAW